MKTSTILIAAAVAFVLYNAAKAKAAPTDSSAAKTTNTGTAGAPISGGPWWTYAGSWAGTSGS